MAHEGYLAGVVADAAQVFRYRCGVARLLGQPDAVGPEMVPVRVPGGGFPYVRGQGMWRAGRPAPPTPSPWADTSAAPMHAFSISQADEPAVHRDEDWAVRSQPRLAQPPFADERFAAADDDATQAWLNDALTSPAWTPTATETTLPPPLRPFELRSPDETRKRPHPPQPSHDPTVATPAVADAACHEHNPPDITSPTDLAHRDEGLKPADAAWPTRPHPTSPGSPNSETEPFAPLSGHPPMSSVVSQGLNILAASGAHRPNSFPIAEITPGPSGMSNVSVRRSRTHTSSPPDPRSGKHSDNEAAQDFWDSPAPEREAHTQVQPGRLRQVGRTKAPTKTNQPWRAETEPATAEDRAPENPFSDDDMPGHHAVMARDIDVTEPRTPHSYPAALYEEAPASHDISTKSPHSFPASETIHIQPIGEGFQTGAPAFWTRRHLRPWRTGLLR
jgi:hypothetical protein